MNTNRYWPLRRLGALVLATALGCATTAMSADIALSGTVYDKDNKALPGIIVSLAQGKLSTVTDKNGGWSLSGATSGLEKRILRSGPSNNLVLENGHLRVRLSGFDANGRGLRSQSALVVKQGIVSARTLAAQDTLLYSLGGQIRLRDTVTGALSGIVRKLDTTWNASITYGYLKDSRDGQQYRTVSIGTQTWMAENLNYKVDSSWWYENEDDSGAKSDSDAKYGSLYKWASSMGLSDTCNQKSCASQVTVQHRGVCPEGWHVPGDVEWTTLEYYVDPTGDETGTKLKSVSGWESVGSVGNGTDEYGFRALPGGYRYDNGSFGYVGSRGAWWSATEDYASDAWPRYMYSYNAPVYRSLNTYKTNAFSLRCLKDGP